MLEQPPWLASQSLLLDFSCWSSSARASFFFAGLGHHSAQAELHDGLSSSFFVQRVAVGRATRRDVGPARPRLCAQGVSVSVCLAFASALAGLSHQARRSPLAISRAWSFWCG